MSAEMYYRRYLSQAQLEHAGDQLQEYSRKRYAETLRLLEDEVKALHRSQWHVPADEAERVRTVEWLVAYYKRESERRDAFIHGDDSGSEAG